MLPLCFRQAGEAVPPRLLSSKLCHRVLKVALERLRFGFKFFSVLISVKLTQPHVRS